MRTEGAFMNLAPLTADARRAVAEGRHVRLQAPRWPRPRGARRLKDDRGQGRNPGRPGGQRKRFCGRVLLARQPHNVRSSNPNFPYVGGNHQGLDRRQTRRRKNRDGTGYR